MSSASPVPLVDRASQPNFRKLFESVPGLYLVLTTDLRIVAASDAYLSATMTVRDQIVGRSLFDVFPDNPNDPAATGMQNLKASLDRVLQSHNSDTMPVQKYDIRRPESQGGGFEERYWSPVNCPVLETDGQISYIIHRVEDVTDFVGLKQNRAEEIRASEELKVHASQMETEMFQRSQELDRTNQRLRNVHDDMEAFIYSVSHDLKAPLRAISGFASILSQESAHKLDPTEREHLASIVNAARKMGDLIEDLLEYSRIAQDETATEPLSLAAVISEAFQQIPPHEDTAEIRIGLPDSLPQVLGHRRTLQQVIVNLLTNARKFVKPGQRPELTLEAE